jgi:predicted phosphoribosyltransferase
MFEDRLDAGRQLAGALRSYREKDPLVLAIPRGGVEVASVVAERIKTDFSLLVSRKLPFPDNPESGFGALAEDGSLYLNESVSGRLDTATIKRIISEQRRVIERRIDLLRGGMPLPEMKGRTLILIDDGLAMGSTMRAALMLCKKRDPLLTVVAVPVAGARVKHLFEQEADDVVVLETPDNFRAVAQVYHHWKDVSDDEVLEILESLRKLE